MADVLHLHCHKDLGWLPVWVQALAGGGGMKGAGKD